MAPRCAETSGGMTSVRIFTPHLACCPPSFIAHLLHDRIRHGAMKLRAGCVVSLQAQRQGALGAEPMETAEKGPDNSAPEGIPSLPQPFRRSRRMGRQTRLQPVQARVLRMAGLSTKTGSKQVIGITMPRDGRSTFVMYPTIPFRHGLLRQTAKPDRFQGRHGTPPSPGAGQRIVIRAAGDSSRRVVLFPILRVGLLSIRLVSPVSNRWRQPYEGSGTARLGRRRPSARAIGTSRPAWSAYAEACAACSIKLLTACFSCESHSSAMVITSISSRLKSTVPRLFCRVLKMLTCRMRDSSTIIGIE